MCDQQTYSKIDGGRYVMATTAHHKLGDISRDEPDLAFILGETETDYIGSWASGLGFAEVRFPKSGCRELSWIEREFISKRVQVIL